MEPGFFQYLIAIIGGFFAGAINTLAGNGSAITLTILTEVLGLPPNEANGTNRIGVMAQSAAASFAFHKNGKLDIGRSKLYIILTVIGAIGGVFLAVWVSNEQFKEVFSYMMVVMLFVILVKPKRWLQETDASVQPNLLLTVPLFLALGFYGGFIQMGMGVFFLGVMVLGARFSLLESNVIKSLIVAIYTIVVIGIFEWKDLIDWRIGAILASGQVVGGWVTANFASKYEKINVWAYWLLIIVVIAAIWKLFKIHEYIFNIF